MNNDTSKQIELPLDERNLAHVFSALSFSGLVARQVSDPQSARCWWTDTGFTLLSPLDETQVLELADTFLRSLRWTPALGVADGEINAKAHHGVLAAGGMMGVNPFISLADSGGEKSPLKTFSGQQDPAKDLPEQIAQVHGGHQGLAEWLSQRAYGVSSWGLDHRVGSHAYDLGFSSNDEGTGSCDPVYPVVELLGLAGAALFLPAQVVQSDESHVLYSIWTQAISTNLVPLAVADRIDGLSVRRYHTSSRGAAYGKGAAYRYFPEATPLENTHGGPNERYS
jgi:hypothetical protein